jgi:uncharacterized membrane protein
MRESPALIESRRFGVRPIPTLRPLGWLALGWRDLRRFPSFGLAHGLVLAAFGAVLIMLAHDQFWLLAGAFSGFLLVAPLSATGLYAISRALERGESPSWRTVAVAWKPEPRLVHFGVLLALAGTGWVVTSASFIAGLSPIPVERPIDFVRGVVLAEHGHLFEIWLLLGGLLAAPVYASSVVALPMLLDRQVGVMVAVLTSWRVVQEHALPLALWAALLFCLTALGLATALLGLVVVAPWLAHASWHAYRDLVDTTGLEARP